MKKAFALGVAVAALGAALLSGCGGAKRAQINQVNPSSGSSSSSVAGVDSGGTGATKEQKAQDAKTQKAAETEPQAKEADDLLKDIDAALNESAPPSEDH